MKYISLILVALLFQSCLLFLVGHKSTVNTAEKTYTLENGSFPADFGKNPSEIFLAIKVGRSSYDKYATGAEFSHFATAKKVYIENLNAQRILGQ